MSKYRIILLLIFIAAFTWSAIDPVISYSYWMLENSVIFAAAIVTVFFGHRLKFTDLSLTLITIYILFPLIASHYGVTGVPFGEKIGAIFGSDKNLYNRLVHFLFGFLTFIPLRELLVNNGIIEKNGWRSYVISFAFVMALSASYEIFEWLAAVTVNPTLAASFYGAQEDIFDGQKDMALSALGSILAMPIAYARKS